MAFLIKSNYVIATHLKKYSSTASFVNKTKAGAVGFVSGIPYFNASGSAIQLLDASNVATVAGKKRTATLVTGATLAPAAADSGTFYSMNRAAGVVVTLPAPVVGLEYEFFVATTFTGTFEIDTDAGTTFLLGMVMNGVEDTTPAANPGPKRYSANGTNITKYKADADTKGRLLGTRLVFTCISSTIWRVSGEAQSAGTIATPFL